MKKRVPVLNNEIYSKILFLINDGEIYASQISSALDKTQATTQRQLMVLEERGYVTLKEHPEKKKNIQLFSINWGKIIEEFFNFLKDRKRKLISEAKITWEDEKREILLHRGDGSIDLLDDKKLIINYENNPYLLILFKESFKQMTQYDKITLKEVFEKIIKWAPRPLEHWSGWRLGEATRNITKKQKEKSELKHLENHLKKEYTKFSKISEEEINLLNQISQKIHEDKEQLKNKDKDLKEFDNLMGVCFKLFSFDPIEEKIDREIYPHLIKKALENNKLD
jgi:DNA-binding transcriptional ArsR family regulator